MSVHRRFSIKGIATVLSFLVGAATPAASATVSPDAPGVQNISVQVTDPKIDVAPNGEIWVSERTTWGNVTVVDPTAEVVIASIDVGATSPEAAVFSRDGKFAYLLVSTFEPNSYWSGIAKVELATHQIVALWRGPHGVNSGVISNDGKVLYLHSQAEGSISLFSTKDGTRLRTLGDTVVDWTVTFNGARTKAFALTNGTLFGIDLTQIDRIFRSRYIGQFSCGVYLSPDESTIWSIAGCLSPTRSIKIYSAKTFKLVDQIFDSDSRFFYGVKFSNDKKRFYLLKWGEISVFSMKNHQLLKAIPVPEGPFMWVTLTSKTAVLFNTDTGSFRSIDLR